MKKYINWEPKKDIYLKEGEVSLHETIHKTWYDNKNFSSKQNRIDYILRAEKEIDSSISGNVLDIGCGNGYSSIFIAKNRNINQVHSLECDINAVDKLIRGNFQYNNIPEDKYELVLGSFNDIKNKNYYNFVISLGAIHHSGNLFQTMKEINSSLLYGGYFIAHEPYMDSLTSNAVYLDKEDNIKNVQGLVNIKESERDDHFFRQCEYLTAFHHSGFEIVRWIELDDPNKKIKNAIMILKKQNYKHIPHCWFK